MLPELDIFISRYTERMNGQFLRNKDLYVLYKEYCHRRSLQPVSNKALTQGMIDMWSWQEPTYEDAQGKTRTRYSKPIVRDTHLNERGWRHITTSWYGKVALKSLHANKSNSCSSNISDP